MTHLEPNGMPEDHAFNPEFEISPAKVAERLAMEKPFILVDCRTGQEREIAMIATSIHAPLHELHLHLENLREHEDTEIAVYCHHGVRSLQVTMALREAGFSDVRSMAGGINLWSQIIDTEVPTY
jgi:rhodanese-related sulfurtransferase